MSQIFDGRQLLLWIELIGCLVSFNLVQGSKEIVCMTEECKLTSQNFYSHLNTAAEPCKDFYEYACGNWFKHHPMPAFVSHWSTRSLMHMKTMLDLRTLLESKDKRTDDKQIVQARKVYKVCMNIPYKKKSDLETIKEYVKKVDTSEIFGNYLHMPFSWWMVDNYYLKLCGESAFFDVSVMADAEGDMEPILHISMLTSVFGNIIQKRTWTKSEMRSYVSFLKEIMKKMLTKDSSKRIAAMIKDDMMQLLNFRIKIEEIKRKTLEQRSDCVRRTIGDFQDIYDKQVNLKRRSEIDWLEHARVLLGDNWGHKVVKTTPIYICFEYYFLELSKLLHVQPERIIVDHIHLYFIERHLILDEKLKVLLTKSISAPVNPSGVTRIDPERWYTCIHNHNMVRTLETMYIRNYFTPTDVKSMKATVGRMADELKDAIKSQISEAEWMENNIRFEAADKILQTRIILGYPEWIDNPKSQPRFDWQLEPLEVNAYNILRKNTIVLYPAILQSPIFSPSLAYVTEYGTFGFTLGHELYHGLTSDALHYDSHGTKKVWWSNSMLNVYEAKEKCFIEEYSKYRVIELEKHLGVIYNNGRRTAAENMADTMGLKAAYLAFEKRLEKMKGKCPILPNFTKSSCEQLFFISFANTFCATMRPITLFKYVQKNRHSTPRTRVNAAVANMPEFSAAFNCRPDSFLNPEKRCDIWH
ncbi:hypothetical protein KM043_015069 [Ampulex compressa]|nr:hypothetical protein KM043_015069 [Ampulex compressa]